VIALPVEPSSCGQVSSASPIVIRLRAWMTREPAFTAWLRETGKRWREDS
jgi:hypothetical protein